MCIRDRGTTCTDVDPFELGMVWEYMTAIIKAMAYAIEATPGADKDISCKEGSKVQVC